MLEKHFSPYPKRKAFSLSNSHVFTTLLLSAVSVSLLYAIPPIQHAEAATAARTVSSPFLYTFNAPGVLEEAGSMNESSSPYFWLSSGGKLIIKNGIGATIQGVLSSRDRWFSLYKKSSSLDTEGGKYPQNLFRLVTRSTWGNLSEEVKFRISATNVTDTPNRDAYSGVFLMSRYADSANLYYAGVRMDGQAVVKKKYKGTYYTLASKKGVFPGTYNRTSNPNLIPEDTWMRLKCTTFTESDGSVTITLLLDRGNGMYETLLTTKDTKTYGGGTLTSKGYAGIRTDFMDVQFDNYRIES